MMKKNTRLAPFAILALAACLATGVQAQPSRNLDSQYMTQIENPQRSDVEDFKVDLPMLQAGQVIRFYVDGEPNARVSVKFNSSGKFTREVPLSETQIGRYTGSYTIRSVDELERKTFTVTLLRGKTKSVAYYKPMYDEYHSRNDKYGRNNRDARQGYEMHNTPGEVHPYPVYKNPDFGVVSRIDVQDARPDQLNMGGAALGAVLGGVLGNQVGGGSGKKAATVIGAIAGGAAGNEIGRNVAGNKIWNVSVDFEDGRTQVYQYPQDPQINVGTRVQKQGAGIAHR